MNMRSRNISVLDLTHSFGLVCLCCFLASCMSPPVEQAEHESKPQEKVFVEMKVPYETRNTLSETFSALYGAEKIKREEQTRGESDQSNPSDSIDSAPRKNDPRHAPAEAVRGASAEAVRGASAEAVRGALAAGNLEAAQADLSMIDPTGNKNPFSALLLTLIQFEAGERAQAREALSRVRATFERSRGSMSLHSAREFEYFYYVVDGMMHLHLGEEEPGFAALSEASLFMPASETHGLVLSRYFREKGSIRLALRVMEEVFSISQEKSSEAYLEMIQVQIEGGNTESADMYLRRALELYPEDNKIQLYLTKSNFYENSPTLACERFAEIYRLTPHDSDSVFNHAYCLKTQGSEKVAISVLEKALLMHSDSLRLKLLLGGLHAQAQNFVGARQAWNSILSRGEGLKGELLLTDSILEALKAVED